MDTSDLPVDDEQRPSKRARLDAPASPTPSSRTASDAAFDDADDLYDTPLRQGTPNVSQIPRPESPASPSTHPLKPQANSIPGLALLSSTAFANQDHGEAPDVSDSAGANGTAEVSQPQANSPASDGNTISSEEAILGVPRNEYLADDDNRKSLLSATRIEDDASYDHSGPVNKSGNGALSPGPSTVGPKTTSPESEQTTASQKVDPEFLEAAKSNKGSGEAEWQYDSSDAESAESSSSSDDSSDASDGADGEDDQDDDEEDYELLDPAEQARILMREHGDGDGGKGAQSNENAQPRTINERVEKVERPDIKLSSDTKILELGTAERIVESHLIVKGITSGETQVPNSGSLLCLENMTVIGVVAEPFGRVDDPRYSVAFPSAADIEELGISIGTTIFYVPIHSTFVFTQSLKTIKGSDASNIHDEEVGDDELEFSDDEAEAEHKRRVKEARLAKKGILPQRRGNSHAPSGRPGPPTGAGTDYPTGPIRYDDDEPDELYTPLTRPDNLHALPPRPPVRAGMFRGQNERSRGGRGHFDRGRGTSRGGRTGRGNRGGRGSMPGDRAGPPQNEQTNQSPPPLHIPSPGGDPYYNGHPTYHPTSPQSFSGQHDPYFRQSASSPNSFAPPPSFWPYPNPATGYVSPSLYNPVQAQMPMTPGGTIPPGSYINPAFFRGQGQSPQPSGNAGSSTSPPPIQHGPHRAPHGPPGPPANFDGDVYEAYDPKRPWI